MQEKNEIFLMGNRTACFSLGIFAGVSPQQRTAWAGSPGVIPASFFESKIGQSAICYAERRLIKFEVCRTASIRIRVEMERPGNLQNERVTAKKS